MDTFHSLNAAKFGIRWSYSYRIVLLNAFVTTKRKLKELHTAKYVPCNFRELILT